MNILWDFDGTLFNTYPAYTAIFKKAVGEDISEEEVFSKLKVSFDHAFRSFGMNEEQEKEVRAQVRELKPEDFLPFPGVVEVLQKANINVIMTHKERVDVENVLKLHKLEHLISEIVAGDDGYPRKPHTASYEYLHGNHQIDIAIGDRELDVIPARQLGIKTCLFQNPNGEADFHLENYAEFNEVVGKYMGIL